MDKNDALTARLADNLDQAFKDVVSLHEHRLFRFLLCHSKSPQDAEEIVQETFLRAYCALRNYPAQRICDLKIQPWLDRIALNILYNRQRIPSLATTSLEQHEPQLKSTLTDPQALPDEEFERYKEQQELQTTYLILFPDTLAQVEIFDFP